MVSRLGRHGRLRRLGRSARRAARGDKENVVRVAAHDERRAREIIAQYADKNFSLTDANSFAVMKRLRIDHAFTIDRHFAQCGFATLGAADSR